MAAKRIVDVVVVPFHGPAAINIDIIFDHSVPPRDLSICPWRVRLGEAMLDVIGLTDQIEAHIAKGDTVLVLSLLCELDAVVRNDHMDFVRHGFQ